LREIRLLDIVGESAKSETGSDGYHLGNDPLWETNELKNLLHGRPKKTKEEQIRRKKEYLREYYHNNKVEMDRLNAAYTAGEIDREEYEKRIPKHRQGWYKTVAETEELANDFEHCRTRLHDIYAQEPPDQNPLPFAWPTTASTDAYQTIVCLCTPVHHLVQISDPVARNIQLTLKTALSPDKDYLNDWMPRSRRETVSAIFNASSDIMNASVNSMDRTAKRQFEQEWIKKRDRFIFSLTGSSKTVPPFVVHELVEFVWAYESKVGNREREDEDTTEAEGEPPSGASLWEDGLAGKLQGISI